MMPCSATQQSPTLSARIIGLTLAQTPGAERSSGATRAIQLQQLTKLRHQETYPSISEHAVSMHARLVLC